MANSEYINNAEMVSICAIYIYIYIYIYIIHLIVSIIAIQKHMEYNMQNSWGGLNYTKETMCTMLEHQTLKTKPTSFETKVK